MSPVSVSLLRSESPKQRRTFTPWLLLIGPGTISILALLLLLSRPAVRDWSQYLTNVAQMWGSCGCRSAVPCSLAWRYCRSHAVAPGAPCARALSRRPVLYLAKLAVIIAEGALASVLMGVLVLAAGLLVIGPGQPVRWDTLAVVAFLPFVGAWPLLGLHLWLAAAKGFAPTFTVAVGGFFTAMVLMANPLGLLSPWTYPLRTLMAALGDKGPAGVWGRPGTADDRIVGRRGPGVRCSGRRLVCA